MITVEQKERIWEIDALRGFFMLFVFASHFIFDLSVVFGISEPDNPVIYFVFQYGGALFVVISGICATLGKKSFRRGAVVLGCGVLIFAVTFALARFGFMDEGDVIQFGILHLLGICMMLYPALKHLPNWALLVFSAVAFGIGLWFENITLYPNTAAAFDIRNYLFVFGLQPLGFAAGDYFPIFPNLSYFMLGILLGRTAYKEKTSLFPNFPHNNFVVRILKFIGRNSLWLYLLHQPVIFAVLEAIKAIS